MKLLDLIQDRTIRVPIKSTDKQSAIGELVDVLGDEGAIVNPDTVRQAVWDRELQRTTGIGKGLAIPHGRCEHLHSMVMAMGIPTQPVDFASPDKRPVELIILLVSPTDNTADHIQALGRISRLMVDRTFRETAYKSTSASELYSMFTNALNASSS